jgi:hydrogenase maturation protease
VGAPIRRIVVLGVGNLLQSDEGVGPHVVAELGRRFRFRPEVELIDGGTSAMELLDDMAEASLLLIVDAVKSGQPPATVVKLTGDEVPRFFTRKLSPHQVGLCDVLATLALTGESPARTVIIGVEPASLALAMELSPAVSAAVPEVLEALLAELRAEGVAVRERHPAAKAA